MLNPTPVLNLAHALLFMREVGGSNRSEIIDEMIRRTGLDPGQRLPWCAAFVAWVGYAVYRKDWPLMRVAGCMSLYADAKGKGLLREQPKAGDIFLLWGQGHDGKMRYKHCGFVEEVRADGTCATLEGNTNEAGSAEGDGVFSRVRRFGAKDVFVRWAGDPPTMTRTMTTGTTATAEPRSFFSRMFP